VASPLSRILVFSHYLSRGQVFLYLAGGCERLRNPSSPERYDSTFSACTLLFFPRALLPDALRSCPPPLSFHLLSPRRLKFGRKLLFPPRAPLLIDLLSCARMSHPASRGWYSGLPGPASSPDFFSSPSPGLRDAPRGSQPPFFLADLYPTGFGCFSLVLVPRPSVLTLPAQVLLFPPLDKPSSMDEFLAFEPSGPGGFLFPAGSPLSPPTITRCGPSFHDALLSEQVGPLSPPEHSSSTTRLLFVAGFFCGFFFTPPSRAPHPFRERLFEFLPIAGDSLLLPLTLATYSLEPAYHSDSVSYEWQVSSEGAHPFPGPRVSCNPFSHVSLPSLN